MYSYYYSKQYLNQIKNFRPVNISIEMHKYIMSYRDTGVVTRDRTFKLIL